MSTTIDSRVVEMRFDNRHFEQNVSHTMSTLEKLKQKLNFSGASQGLEGVGKAAKNVNMSGLGNAIETVHAKFSALEVMGVTALANITNSAVNAGKKMISALTIDPVKSGFQEYETQMNAIQTILANTESKGSTLEDVNAALDELNKYADQTIYNFTEMTRNIGTFTAAGVDLETSVNAIQGIANLAAMSGSNSQQASTAMYQLSQALAAGTVKLMDWNSVVNAGMGGEMFQTALKETSKLLGTGAEAAIKAEGSFRESLRTGWLTSEVLTETLKKFTATGANERVAEYTGLSKEAVEAALEEAKAVHGEADAIKYASEALAEKSGKNAKEIEDTLKFAQTAQDAATKVKTFTQLWDVLKEAAQSGWAQTWRLIVGDFEQAKGLLSPLADFLVGIINGFSEARNALLESALGKSFSKLKEQIGDVVNPIKKSADSVKDVVRSVEEYANVVNEIIGGKWGNGQERWDKLTKAGYDWAHAQNLVNEKLGNGVRRATDYKEAQEGMADAQEQTTKAQEDANESTGEYIAKLVDLSDAELRHMGYQPDQIKAFRELAKAAEQTGIPLKDFVDNIDEIDGRYLLINSFKNAGQGLVLVFKAIGEAWKDAFPPMQADQLFGIIAGLHKFSTNLVMSEETADKLTRTLKGVFAIVGMITDILGGGLKIAFKLVSSILGYFNMDILTVTASIGDAIVKFREMTDISKLFDAVIAKVMPTVINAAKGIRSMVEAFMDLPMVKTLIDNVKKSFENLKSLNMGEIGKYIIDGFAIGLREGAKRIFNAIIEIGQTLIDSICTILGIHSPSVVFMTIGGFVVAGLILGIQNGLPAVWDVIKGMGSHCVKLIKEIDMGQLIAVGLGAGIIYGIKRLTDVLEAFTAPLEGLGEMFEGIGNMFNGLASSFKAAAFEKRARGVLYLAIAVGVLAASLALIVHLNKGDELWQAIGAITALAIIMGLFALAAGKLTAVSGTLGKPAAAMLGIAASLLILAIALNKIAKIDGESVDKVIKVLLYMVGSLAAMVAVFGIFVTADKAKVMNKAGIMLTKMSLALLVMVLVIKQIDKLDDRAIVKGIGVITALGMLFGVMVTVSAMSGQYSSKVGGMIFKMSVAMLIMIGLIKIIDNLEGEAIMKGIGVIAVLGLLFAAIIATSNLAGQHATKAGAMLLMMSMALAVTVGVIKRVSELDDSALKKGTAVIAALEVLFAGLIAVSYFAGKNAVKAGTMLLMISGALVILTGIMFIMSKMDPDGLKRSLGVITVLELLFGGLIAVTHLAQDCKGTLTVLVVAIGLLVVALAALTILDPKELAISAGILSAVMGMFAILIYVTKYANTTTGAMKSLALLAGVVLLLSGILAAFAILSNKYDVNTIVKCAYAIGVMINAFSTSIFLLGKANAVSNSNKSIKFLGTMIVVTGMLTLFIGLLSQCNPASAIASAVAIGVLLNAFSASILVLSQSGDIKKSVFDSLWIMIVVATAMTALIAALSFCNPVSAMASAVAIGVLLNAFSSSMLILGLTKKKVGKIPLSTIAVMIGVAAAMTALIAALSFCDPVSVIPAATAIGILLNAFASSMLILGLVKGLDGGGGKLSKGGSSPLAKIAMMVAVAAALTALIAVLSFCDPLSVLASTVAISALLNAFASAMLILSYSKGLKKIPIDTIVTMGLVAVALGAFIGLLSYVENPMALIPATIALGVLLNAFASAMLILGQARGLRKIPVTTIAAMGLVAGGLALFIGLLSQCDPVSVIGSAVGLGILLNAMASAMLILGLVNPVANTAVASLGVLTLVVGGIAVILGLMSHFDISVSLETAASLSLLLVAMSGALVILGFVGTMGPAAYVGIGALATMIAGIGGLIVGIGALMEKFPQLEEFLNKGIPVIEKIGNVIGSFFGNIISGFAEGATSGLPEIGNRLSEFMNNASGFISGAKNIDAGSMDNVKALAGAILALTAADLLNGIMTIFSSDSSLADLGMELSNFMVAATPFFVGLKMLDASLIESAKSVADIIIAITAAEILSGMTSWLTGNVSFEDFGKQLVELGKGLADFSSAVDGKVNEGAVQAAANAATIMASFQKDLYGSGGVVQWFLGEKNMAEFGDQLVSFGEAIVSFSDTVDGKINEGAVKAAADAGLIMVELQKAIEPTNGLLQSALGTKDLSEFGSQLKSYGTALVDFSKTVSADGAINTKAVEAARDSGLVMTELQKAIEPIGGVISWFTGEKGLDTFGNQLKTYGSALVEFSKTVSADGAVDATAIEAASKAGLLMATLQEAIPEKGWFDGKVSLEDFGKHMKKFAEQMVGYSELVTTIDATAVSESLTSIGRLVTIVERLKDVDFSGIDKFNVATIGEAMKAYHDAIVGVNVENVATSVESAQKVSNLIKGLKDLDTSGVDPFKQAIASLGEIDYNVIAQSLSASVEGLDVVGQQIVNNIVSGIKANQESVPESVKAMINLAANGLAAKYPLFNTVGIAIMGQLQKGIASAKVNITKSIEEPLSKAVSSGSTYQSKFYNLGKQLVGKFKSGLNENLKTLGAIDVSAVGASLADSVGKGITSKTNYVMIAMRTVVLKALEVAKNNLMLFDAIGAGIMDHIAKSVSDNTNKLKQAISTSLKSATVNMKSNYNDFYSAGRYLVDGFAKGISDNAYKAKAKSAAMAKAALTAAEKTLDIHSPSRVFYGIGEFAGLGFVNALDDYGVKAYRASSEMAERAKTGLRDAISRVSDLIDSDIDVQPTIRPVLDLSDVESGAGAISRLFNTRQSIGLMGNVKAISTSMSQNGQNGESEIVSAINKLRKDLSNIGGPSYNINGITYDDGSNIASAMESIVRAARIERRV